MRQHVITMLALTVLGAASCTAEQKSDAGAAPDQAEMKTKSEPMTYRTIKFNTIAGETTSLADFEGKAIVIVNTASECGYTSQYAGLQELYEKYSDSGLVVIGFPANNFGNQEPGTNAQIKEFCASRFDVRFPMMAKVSVRGEDKHPLYTYLTEQSPVPGEIKWNFNKFVLDREGNVIARFDSPVTPLSDKMQSAVRQALGDQG